MSKFGKTTLNSSPANPKGVNNGDIDALKIKFLELFST